MTLPVQYADHSDPALQLAAEAGYSHLLLPGNPRTKKPRVFYATRPEATPTLLATWQRDFHDRNILWMVRAGWYQSGQLAILDTDTPMASVLASQHLPDTWTVSTPSNNGHYHRWFLLADDPELYDDTGQLDYITLRVGMTAVVGAPGAWGYQAQPGFGQGEPARLTAAAWNTYIRHMKRLDPPAKADAADATRSLPDQLPDGDGNDLCCNRSLGWREEGDHYR